MDSIKNDKIERVLAIYTKLINGYVINKSEEAVNYGMSERSIQRDIDDIRNFLDLDAGNTGLINTVIYDRIEKGYRLEKVNRMALSNSEALAICKILLESRAFTKKEMQGMLHKLIEACVPQSNQKLIKSLIANEEFHYIEPHHKTIFIDKMWKIGQAIQECKYINIDYLRVKGKMAVTRKLQPAAIIFSEYYFYLAAFIDDENIRKDFDIINDSFPTIYRIDRIDNLKVLDERFHIPYSNRFEEGEFRKRIQFMYGGKLQRIKFKYKGESIEAVLDRLPTAKIIDEDESGITIYAEVFGKGIDIWVKSQAPYIEVLEEK